MLKKAFYKNAKAMVAIATIACILMTNTVPVIAADQKKNGSVMTVEAQGLQKYRNVMYYGDWSIWGGQKQFNPKDIPADQLTHLNFAFLDFDEHGNLQFTDKDAAMTHAVGNSDVLAGEPNAGILNGFKVLKSENPNLRIGVSLGGWSKSGDFSKVCANKESRTKFVQNVMTFIKYTNMDFVDVDWEYPTFVREPDLCDNSRDEGTKYSTSADKENFIDLLQDLRNALDAQGKELNKTYELSVALPAPIEKVSAGIDVPKLFSLVDFANIMTYDMRGAWDNISGHQTGLYTNSKDPFKDKGLSIDESVKYYLSQGAPSEKIVIGAAYYNRGWEKVSSEETATATPGLFGDAALVTTDADGTPTTGAWPEAPLKNGEGGRMTGVWSYNALDALKSKYSGLKEYWDDEAKAPYLYNPTTGAFFSYDNVKSIQEKCKYVKENNLGGMIAWMASMDKTTTSTKRDELTKATKESLFGSVSLPKYDVSSYKVNVTAKIEPTKAIMGSSGNSELKITITNNEKLSESDEVLSAVELPAKTLMNPTLYLETYGLTISGVQYPLESSNVVEENGKYVIKLSDTYDGKFIKPGESKTYTLDTKESVDNLEGVISLTMNQRVYKSSQAYGGQTLYGYSSDEETVTPDGNTLPNIAGVRNKKIVIGDKFNPLEGITALDKEDGDITSKIVVTGVVDVSKEGKYELIYSVKDNNGGERVLKAVITVGKKTIIEADNYDSKKSYSKGDIVVYAGRRYECVWYSASGIIPGTMAAIWKDLVSAEIVIEPDPTQEIQQPNGNYLPTLWGVKDSNILIGDDFDPLVGIKALDKEDGDITSKIVVTGTVDTTKTGKYELMYSIKDSSDAERSVKAVVTVVSNTTPPKDDYSATKNYVMGDVVIYNGHKYECIWYSVQGITPGTMDVIWKDLGVAE